MLPESQTSDLLWPLGSTPYGKSFELWTEAWWRWFLDITRGVHPALDQTGERASLGQDYQNMWFFCGTIGGAAKRRCKVPSAASILFPIIIDEQSFAERPELKSDRELEDLVSFEANKVLEMAVSIDGQELFDLRSLRIKTCPFDVTLPEDNIWGVKAGPTRAAADGYWIFLKPLQAGTHSLHFFGRGPSFMTEVTYDLMIDSQGLVT